MPYAKTASGYPTEFRDYALRCSQGAVVSVSFETERAARGMRARWYQFVSACKRDAMAPPPWVEKGEAVTLAKMVIATEVKLEGAALIFRNRDASPTAAALQNAVITFPEAKGSMSADASLDKLMGKLKEGGE